MRSRFRVVIALIGFSWGCLSFVVHAQEDLVAKAQKERELIVYGTALAAQFDKFSEPFKRRYPFIKTQYSRSTGEALTTKIFFEASAQQLSPDVVLINNYTHRIFMKKNIITPTCRPLPEIFRLGSSTNRATGWDFTWYLTRSLTTRCWCPKGPLRSLSMTF